MVFRTTVKKKEIKANFQNFKAATYSNLVANVFLAILTYNTTGFCVARYVSFSYNSISPIVYSICGY
jgi:hypothetical protein